MAERRVLVIDDSAYNRRALKQMLERSLPEGTEIVTARDGQEALQIATSEEFSAVTLDLEMPMMDGFTFLRLYLHMRQTPVIVVSSRNDRRSIIKALELGAVDFVAKPIEQASTKLYQIERDLAEKVEMAMSVDMGPLGSLHGMRQRALASVEPAKISQSPEVGEIVRRAVVIASSTGGPRAVQAVLSELEPLHGTAVLIAQHMPRGFTHAFAERLRSQTGLDVYEAHDLQEIRPRSVYVAPGGTDLGLGKVAGQLRARLAPPHRESKYTPSADVLMAQAVALFGASTLGVVLTGMGNDGAEGAKAIKAAGGTVYTESADTAVVYGMPRIVHDAGHSDESLKLEDVAKWITHWVRKERKEDTQ